MVYRATTPLSNARIRALWADLSLTKDTMHLVAGCSYDTLRSRAKALGLGPRPVGQRPKLGGGVFEAMCLAGVRQREIAAHFGVSQSSVSHAIDRFGLDRAAIAAAPRLTLVEFYQMQLRKRAMRDRLSELETPRLRTLQPVCVPRSSQPLSQRRSA
jgi:hypothetical protein